VTDDRSERTGPTDAVSDHRGRDDTSSRRRWLCTVGTGASALLGGCLAGVVDESGDGRRTGSLSFSGSSPMYGVDAARRGVTDGSVDGRPTLRWRTPFDRRIVSTPAVVGDLLYVGCSDEYLYALDATTGERAWRYHAGRDVRSSPAVAGDRVFVGSMDGSVVGLSRVDGQVAWRRSTDSGVFASPAVADGVVYVGDVDGSMYALDTDSGDALWTVETDGPLFCSPAVADGTVYVADYERSLYALDAATGRVQWHSQVDDFVYTAPAVADGTVYVARSGVTAFDAATGERRWSVGDNRTSCSPTLADESVVVVKDTVRALSPADGSTQWEFDPDGAVSTSATVGGDTAFVGDSDGTIYGLDVASGTERWRVSVLNGIGVPLTVVAGALFAVTDPTDGAVYGFEGP